MVLYVQLVTVNYSLHLECKVCILVSSQQFKQIIQILRSLKQEKNSLSFSGISHSLSFTSSVCMLLMCCVTE